MKFHNQLLQMLSAYSFSFSKLSPPDYLPVVYKRTTPGGYSQDYCYSLTLCNSHRASLLQIITRMQ
jgi:hypothetical protein